MGILRVYLALCVIANHSSDLFPWRMHGGQQAVQIFYILSGFYMAMVLSTRYSTIRDFYVSRFVRIFPAYWITLVATIVLSVISGLLFQQWLLLKPYVSNPSAHNGITGIVLAAASNLTLFGQDWIMFLSQDTGHPLHFTNNFSGDASPLYHYLLVPQCWSVGVELTFYACAPYLNRLRSQWLVLIAILALEARWGAYWLMQREMDPWTYRFFPFELSLFLVGMLGYRLYARTASYHPSGRFRCNSRGSYIIGAVILLLLLCLQARAARFFDMHIPPGIATPISYVFWALYIPALFFVFGNQKDDRAIGELSYPIYLVHFAVIAAATPLLKHFHVSRGVGAISAFLSILVSVAFYHLCISRFDKKRHNLNRSASKQFAVEPVKLTTAL